MLLKIRLSLLFCLFLTGCSLGPKYEPPSLDMPEDWHSLACQQSENSLDDFIWWQALQDPILNLLIESLAEQNLDLHIALTRILEARIERKGKCAEKLPHIDGSVTGGHLYMSKDALVNGLLNSLHKEEKHHVKRNVDFFELGFDAEWEIDLFGRIAHEVNAISAEIEASEEALTYLWVTLSAEVARNYIELRSQQQRLEILNKSIVTHEDSLHLTRELWKIGLMDEHALKNAQEQFHLTLAGKPLIELSIDKTIHRLSILLGYFPGDLFELLAPSRCLPLFPEAQPIGVPSELLRRRADIRKAERELAAATERVGSAIASLFPHFTLLGFIGDISTHVNKLFTSPAHLWFAAPQLLLPVFNSKMLMQDVKYSKIKTQEALYNYQKTVLIALEEAENALSTLRYEKERHAQLQKAHQVAEEALHLSSDLYERGVTSYFEVLESRRALELIEESYLNSQTELLFDYVALYKALGGGFCQEN